MPLNKLENFIKNTEGRILYVNPNDLDATDSVDNLGNSLTKPFKTIQRALIESARFSYLKGDDNDITEKTTILVFPGEHLIDNRPGYAIANIGNSATAIAPNGSTSFAGDELTLTLNSNFDLTQEDNILYKFNSVYGGIIIPRGTSIVGLDLRKTKIRPKYVPNPTDSNVKQSAIFRITGACYFWQFTFFDGDESGLVYTDPSDFSTNNQSKPTFSHHKLTCFEYADGKNPVSGYSLTDLDMYYSKVGNAYNRASGREIDQKFPAEPDGFAKQRPEWEIVGAFASDPVTISSIISGDGASNPGNIVTVTTQKPHGLTSGTPIKIRGINVADYNISTKVTQVINENVFTYTLNFVRINLPAGPAAGLAPGPTANVTIETDTVSGASPYVFNVSLRSVFGMQGMHADGSKADGFKSMVVAQFTAVSLQKDDRAFVKYLPSSRTYDSISVTKTTGAQLSAESSSENQEYVYHLDSDAIYRNDWKTTHIKMSNDAVIQVVSVFAIGFHKHFEALSGGDASITNSNSNFGQFSLAADGFKAEAFGKDNKGYITNVVAPKAIVGQDIEVEWVQFDVTKTKSVGINNHLYLLGYTSEDIPPPVISQGYRIGAKVGDRVYVDDNANFAEIRMTNGPVTATDVDAAGTDTSAKVYTATIDNSNKTIGTFYTTNVNHKLKNGESVRIFSETGDLPEGLEPNTLYYAITDDKKNSLLSNQIQLASSRTNAEAQIPLYITSFGGVQLRIESRVSDKEAGELGSPIQWDSNQNQWFVHTDPNSALYQYIQSITVPETEISYVLRREDDRSLDEKIYKIRYVVPKNLVNGRAPVSGFILQDSSSTTVRQNSDFTLTTLDDTDYDFDRNPRFITTCTFNSANELITIRSDRPHELKLNDKVIVKNVASTTNTVADDNIGYNGTFTVSGIIDDKTFTTSNTDIFDLTHNPGNITSDVNVRTVDLPRFTRNDIQENLYVYRVEVINEYIYTVQDGVYYLYVLNANNQVAVEFDESKYSQKVTDLYPQLDRDNYDDNPESAQTFTKRFPIGDVVTNDLKRSISRESIDKYLKAFSQGNTISAVTDNTTSALLTFDSEHHLGGVKQYTTLNGGNGHSDGIYYNVRLFNNNAAPASAAWDGATANVTVSGGAVSDATIVEGGSGYTDGEQLYFDSSTIGGTPQANVVVNTAGISTAEGNYVQITGIGTTAGGYFRISSINSKNQISIAKTAGDPLPIEGQYALNLGRVVNIQQDSYDSTTGIATFTAQNGAHGLLAGNSFRILDSSDLPLGDYIVNSVNSVTEFTSKTSVSVGTAAYALKHGLSANNASAGDLGENLGIRALSDYDNEILVLQENISTQDQFRVALPSAGIGTMNRFPLGSYIQVDSEIMRVVSDSLTGTLSDEITVIRGAMGTLNEPHLSGSFIKKIKLNAVEFRRPSILRASGHTFEYLGYGPGNYSTGLPQVQVKTLTEKEEFLSQAQETSCGTVLYTGMDSDGDFYIGNTKYSAQSGEQTTFDVPTPTITGEDPNRLSVVFDEVIVKERILVEGGNSGQILSQFDGPVTFNGDVRMTGVLVLNNNLRVLGTVDFRNETDAQNSGDQNAALRVLGGVAIGKRLWVGNVIHGESGSVIAGIATFNTGIVPDTDEGAYIGTQSTPWSSAYIGEIRIADGGGTDSNDNEIDTVTGNLILDSAAGTTIVDDQLRVSGISTFESTESNIIGDVNTGAVQVDGGVGIAENLSVGGDFDVDGNTTLDDTTIDGTVTLNGNLNAGTNTITATTFSGQATDADQVKTEATSTDANHYITFVDSNNSTATNQSVYTDGDLYYNPNTNNLFVGADIYAFVSDDRLKDNKVGITNALDKVNSLSGFTYTLNDTAAGYGYNTSTRHAGVSAQEVEKVLPEVIGESAIGDGYVTVKYDKLVPLLIEAIKELSAKVSDLENRLNN